MIKRALIFMLGCSMFCFPYDLHANDSVYSGDGVDVFPLESTAIQMVDEVITITDNGARGDRFDVEVNMTLKNHGPQASAQLGFPILADDVEGEKVEFNPHFRTWINGKEANIVRKRGIPNAVKNYPYFSDNVFTYQVILNKDETIKIHHKYTVGGSFDSGGGWDFTYILRTGALWKDSIKSLTIIYKTSDSTAKEIYKTQPSEQKREHHGDQTYFIWNFKNYKPNSDFKISGNYQHGLLLTEGMSNEEAIKNMSAYYKGKLYDGDERIYTEDDILFRIWMPGERFQIKDANLLKLNAVVLRNEIYARHGRIFATPELKRIFESARWYKPRTDFKDSDLNDTEKKNVEFIYAFERNRGWR